MTCLTERRPYFKKKSIREEVKFLEHPVSIMMRLTSFSVYSHPKQGASKGDCNNCLGGD